MAGIYKPQSPQIADPDTGNVTQTWLTKLTQLMDAAIFCTTTNDNALAGKLGEVITSNIASGSAVGISNGVAANVTSINLTAGDWDVYGWVSTSAAGSTTASRLQVGISTTTANLGSFPTRLALSVPAGQNVAAPAATQRQSLSGNTTVYLVVQVDFAVSSNAAYGYITARRAR